jgi:hypothetical protein
MGHDFCIDTPPEVEGPLTNARYAYATFEAQRIIEQHGIECVAEILDLACKDKTNDSRNLDEAIREVTGEDIPKRFQRYQTFKTPSEGLAKYTEQFGAAMARKDYPEALMNLLHRLEVEGIGNPMYYGTAAYLLQKMGYEGLADQAILKPLGLMKRRGTEDSLLGMQTIFIIHAIKCGKLSKAHSMAEEVLKSKPDTIPALMVRLDRLVSLGKLDKAEKTARHILKLDNNPKSPARRLAQKTLERLKKTE